MCMRTLDKDCGMAASPGIIRAAPLGLNEDFCRRSQGCALGYHKAAPFGLNKRVLFAHPLCALGELCGKKWTGIQPVNGYPEAAA